MLPTPEEEPTSLVTLQFGWGGFFDFEPLVGTYNICLITGDRSGLHTLCGRDRFAEDTPGWSVGGGVSGPGVNLAPCHNCAQVAAIVYSGRPLFGPSDHVEAFVALDLGLKSARP